MGERLFAALMGFLVTFGLGAAALALAVVVYVFVFGS